MRQPAAEFRRGCWRRFLAVPSPGGVGHVSRHWRHYAFQRARQLARQTLAW